MRILESLNVWGFDRRREDVLMAALLTGEPLMMVGNIGTSKSTLASKIAKAIQAGAWDLKYRRYNANTDNFDDMIGWPSTQGLANDEVRYIGSDTVIWDKDIVFIDEANRAKASTQSKWLTFLDKREMCGITTACKIMFGAMNPMGVAGTNELGEATIGRFASFIYAPELHEMSQSDQCKVIESLPGDCLPGLDLWNQGTSTMEARDPTDYAKVGGALKKLLSNAAVIYEELLGNSKHITTFLQMVFAEVHRAGDDNKGNKVAEDDEADKVIIDGRRAGFVRRHVLACRAISIARAATFATPLPPLDQDVLHGILSSVPLGLNSESGRSEAAEKKLREAIKNLSPLLGGDGSEKSVRLHMELLVSNDPIRQAEILLTEKIDDIAKGAVWSLISRLEGTNMIIGDVAAMIEIEQPNTIPPSVLALIAKMSGTTVRKKGGAGASGKTTWEYLVDVWFRQEVIDKETRDKFLKDYTSLADLVNRLSTQRSNRMKPAPAPASTAGMEIE